MQLALKFRNMLPNIVREELDSLVAMISGFFSVEHKADGRHGAVTCDSLVVGGMAVVGTVPVAPGVYVPSAYTPVWTAGVGAPVLGNGTIVGQYVEVGKLVFFDIVLTWGSTTASTGTGGWNFSLPRTMANLTFGAFPAWALDASANLSFIGIAHPVTTTVVAIVPSNAAGAGFVGGTGTPFTFAAGDVFTISGCYAQA